MDGGAPQLQWQPDIGGCESGFTIPDPTTPNIVYASCYGNKVTRWDARTGTARSIEPWMVTLDSPPNEAKYRCHWTAPMAIDPFDHEHGALRLPVDPEDDQRRPVVDRGQPRSLDEGSVDASSRTAGIVGDNLGQYNGEVVWDDRVLEDPEGA